MSSMRICSNSVDNELVGIRGAVVQQPLAGSYSYFMKMSEHGKVNDFSLRCTNFTLDWKSGEFVQFVEAWFDTQRLNKLKLTTNIGKSVTVGSSSDIDKY